jgi:hypothetical protein
MRIVEQAPEGRYEFTVDDATGALSFQHPIMVSGFTIHQVRALAEFYERVTGDRAKRDGFNLGTARDRVTEIGEKIGGLPLYGSHPDST